MSDDQWDLLNNKRRATNSNKDLKIGYNYNKNNFPQSNGIPWSINSISWGSGINNLNSSVVEFTATPFDKNVQLFSNLHCKRKAETEPTVPRKQLITEEKMAASFDGMHISGDYTAHNIDTSNNVDNNGVDNKMDLEIQGPRIVLSPELMKIKTEPILPQSILNRIEKPCTSLVLWRPPKKILQTEEENKDPNNNPEETGDSGSGSRRRGVLVDEISNDKPSTSNSNNYYSIDMEM